MLERIELIKNTESSRIVIIDAYVSIKFYGNSIVFSYPFPNESKWIHIN